MTHGSERSRRAGLAGLVAAAILAATSSAQVVVLFSENFEGPPGPPGTVGAYAEVDPLTGVPGPTLWNEAADCAFLTPLPACFGTGAAAYNLGDLGIYTYDTGAANTGALESPPVLSLAAASTLLLAFDYVKETEAGGVATFDQCFVETSPAGAGAWSVALQVTGNTGGCGPIVSQVAILPAGLAGILFQHRFRFNTVDAVANGFYGWAVDNIRVGEAPGGAFPAFAEAFGVGTIPGVTVGTMAEEDPAGVPADTLWHAEAFCDAAGTPIPAPLAGVAAAYNQGDLGIYTYDTGAANEGALVSPAFALPVATIGATVAFDMLKQTEGGGATAFDQCFVEARDSLGGAWGLVGQLGGNQLCAAGGTATSVSGGPGVDALLSTGGGQVRLRFDTVDGVGNAFAGWYVDNLLVSAQVAVATPITPPGCASSGGCVPTISASGLPAVGNTSFAISLAGAQPGTLGVLIIGVAPAVIPLGLILPGNGCILLETLDILISPLPVSAGVGCTGTASVPLPISCGTPIGATAFLQFAVVEVGIYPAPASVSMTPGMAVTTF